MDCTTSPVYSDGQQLAGAQAYLAYSSPPHSPYFWTDFMNAPAPPDDIYQMQHLRFPTPPITPPKSLASATATRTQSVIMKVGQVGRQTEHMPATLYAAADAANSNCSLNSSTSNSSSCSPATDFICAWADCGRFFQSLESLAQHVTQIHAVPAPADGLYYCQWHGCQRSERGFNARYKMLVHVRTHTKEKPHQCHMCTKSFSRAENLKIHIRSHSGEKPYKCTFEGCHKAYSNSSDRFKHTRTHTMEKPYMCKVPGCQKRYTDPSSLRKHVKTFKHSLQIMCASSETAAAAVQTSDKQHTTLPARRYSTERCDYSTPHVAEYALSPIPNDEHYNYMRMQAEHELSMRASGMPAFYTHASTHWLADGLVSKRIYPYASDYAMQVDVEHPLDLRINRV